MRTRAKFAVWLSVLLLFCLSMTGCAAEREIKGLFARPIEFACGKFRSDSQELSISVNAEELLLLDGFKELRYVDFTDSSCYEEIAQWAEAHPHVEISCLLPLPNGVSVQIMAQEADLSGLKTGQAQEAAERLSWMPQLTAVELGSSTGTADELSIEDLISIKTALPGVHFNTGDYSFQLFGQSIFLQQTELNLSHIASQDVDRAISLVSNMPQLQKINLGKERTELSWEAVLRLQSSFPDIEQSYEFELYGRTFNIKDSSMDLSYIELEDNGESLRAILPYLPRCTYVDMDSCGIGNEDMAELQAQFPDKKIVWRLFFGTAYTVRTDAEKILASRPSRGGHINEKDLMILQYCSDLKYLDLGHNARIGDLSFLSVLPKLEVGIFALTSVEDIGDVENCKNLEYLELYISNVSTVEPLRGLTKLKHLNIGCTNVSDISPLYELDLERLWIGRYTPVPEEQIAKMQELHPDCVINTTAYDPDDGGWRHMKVAEGEYVIHPRYAQLREVFGYSLSDYNFVWNDEEYWDHYKK